MPTEPSVSPAQRIAALVHEGFDTFYAEFMRLTRQSRRLFDACEWVGLHEESHRRIDLYLQHVARTLGTLSAITSAYPQDLGLWTAAHTHYDEMVSSRPDVEVARTFFNAITRKIFRTVGVKPQIEFLENDFDEQVPERPGFCRRFELGDDLEALFTAVLRHPRPSLSWVDEAGDARYLAARFREAHPDVRFDHVDVLETLFFRVREGYIVGRLVRGDDVRPLIIPVQSVPGGAVVDGAMFGLEEAQAVFSSTRAYMFVDLERPSDMVRFLGTLMPGLSLSERYISIAHHRHGKTLIYRELVEHLRDSTDRFVVAPGIRGLVMTVFTMPSYRNVFKIIRDRFDKPGATREGIMRSYRDVFRGRRVGRLADTQEFEHLAFDRDRFTEDCLRELLDKASDTVRVVGDKVVVSHLYIEEKMTPLNIYMAQAPIEDAERAIVDYGSAIKELAANDIFAGDLLWKNFGLTHYGQLVLYDYDEICPLTACRFRAIPPARSWEDELSARPWYPVDEADVFPEEWEPFIVPRRSRRLRDAFMAAHADIFTPRFWRSKQADVRAGELHIGLPYSPRKPELQRVKIRRPGMV
jgi:isocitrate dehydrogenase kinase/phosphatase